VSNATPKIADCFYCFEQQSTGSCERDHFPLPKRYGGTEVVWACKPCHTLKDRYRLNQVVFGQAVNWLAQRPFLIALINQTVLAMAGKNEGQPAHWPWSESPAEVWRQVDDQLTDPLSRIFVARMLAGRETPAWDFYFKQQEWIEEPSWW
jgi:hypothetical protein